MSSETRRRKPKAKVAVSQTANTSTTDQSSKRYAVIRIRGINGVLHEIHDTLDMLHLKRINNLSFVDTRASYIGMLQKSKDYITWGEPSAEVITQLLHKWGRVIGNQPLTDDYIAKNSKFKSIKEFSEQFVNMKAEIKDIQGLKPFIRLHPPTGGHRGKGVKYAYHSHGSFGNRVTSLNDLIMTMSGL